MLYIVGLGLGDEKDITLKGLEAIKSCTKVYLEAYTSILTVDKSRLEALYGKEVIIADRELVESSSDQILENADKQNVAFLVVGDPFGATTHTDLVIRAKELNIEVISIHNASIMNAVGACGLQLYNFGQAVSLCFFTETWRPDSFYPRVLTNSKAGMHTLCLLDIKVKEQSIENMARGRLIYEPPRFMTVYQAAQQLIEVELKNKSGAYDPNHTLAVAVARLGSGEQRMVCATLTQFAASKSGSKTSTSQDDESGEEEELIPIIDMGPPLHSLVLVGSQLHFLEAQLLRNIAYDLDTVNQVLQAHYHAEQ